MKPVENIENNVNQNSFAFCRVAHGRIGSACSSIPSSYCTWVHLPPPRGLWLLYVPASNSTSKSGSFSGALCHTTPNGSPQHEPTNGLKLFAIWLYVWSRSWALVTPVLRKHRNQITSRNNPRTSSNISEVLSFYSVCPCCFLPILLIPVSPGSY